MMIPGKLYEFDPHAEWLNGMRLWTSSEIGDQRSLRVRTGELVVFLKHQPQRGNDSWSSAAWFLTADGLICCTESCLAESYFTEVTTQGEEDDDDSKKA